MPSRSAKSRRLMRTDSRNARASRPVHVTTAAIALTSDPPVTDGSCSTRTVSLQCNDITAGVGSPQSWLSSSSCDFRAHGSASAGREAPGYACKQDTYLLHRAVRALIAPAITRVLCALYGQWRCGSGSQRAAGDLAIRPCAACLNSSRRKCSPMDRRAIDMARVWHMRDRRRAHGSRQLTAARGVGPYLIDTEGRRYLDAASGTGAAILGYGDRRITSAMTAQLA